MPTDPHRLVQRVRELAHDEPAAEDEETRLDPQARPPRSDAQRGRSERPSGDGEEPPSG